MVSEIRELNHREKLEATVLPTMEERIRRETWLLPSKFWIELTVLKVNTLKDANKELEEVSKKLSKIPFRNDIKKFFDNVKGCGWME